MFGLGFGEILVILVIALLVFGPEKLPEIARTLGKTAAELRRGMDDLRQEFNTQRTDFQSDLHRPEANKPDANRAPQQSLPPSSGPMSNAPAANFDATNSAAHAQESSQSQAAAQSPTLDVESGKSNQIAAKDETSSAVAPIESKPTDAAS